MTTDIRFLLVQSNPTVGALFKNTEFILNTLQFHITTHDVIIFPELALTGYPPEDLLFHDSFYEQMLSCLIKIQSSVEDQYVILGHPWMDNHKLYNAASVFHKKECIARYYKQALPNEGVFDEKRYFHPGPHTSCLIQIKQHFVGLCICEDLWHDNIMQALIAQRPDVIVCINASPFEIEKSNKRQTLLKKYANQGPTLIYLNLVGGQDELVFDGQSMVYGPGDQQYLKGPGFKEAYLHFQWPSHSLAFSTPRYEDPDHCIYEALCLGLKDYVHKNGFNGVLLGLSGGIDSALTLAIAVDSLGADAVTAVLLPSQYTSTISHEDALAMIHTFGVQSMNLSIEPVVEAVHHTLSMHVNTNNPNNITVQNIQARTRGLLLMALSNEKHSLLLSTSNKSELAVGYSTLYGDMCGAFNVLKDVLKTTVYRLAHYRNKKHPVIPERVLTRPPSAELAPNQTDQQTLPEYELLDAIIIAWVEKKQSIEALIALGYPEDTVRQVIMRIQHNEYKRFQSAPGVKISTVAFNRDWRYPMTSQFEL